MNRPLPIQRSEVPPGPAAQIFVKAAWIILQVELMDEGHGS